MWRSFNYEKRTTTLITSKTALKKGKTATVSVFLTGTAFFTRVSLPALHVGTPSTEKQRISGWHQFLGKERVERRTDLD